MNYIHRDNQPLVYLYANTYIRYMILHIYIHLQVCICICLYTGQCVRALQAPRVRRPHRRHTRSGMILHVCCTHICIRIDIYTDRNKCILFRACSYYVLILSSIYAMYTHTRSASQGS